MLHKRSRRAEEKSAETLLSELLREVMPDGGKIPARQLSDGRARVQLREKPFLALEVEKCPTGAIRTTQAKSLTGEICPTRTKCPTGETCPTREICPTGAEFPTGAKCPETTGQEGFRARLLTETKEEIFLFPSFPPFPSSPDLSSDVSSCADHTDPAAALAARLRAELTRPTAPASSPEARKYRLKVNVLEDFTYLPRWKELGRTDVRIGGEIPPENRDDDPGDADADSPVVSSDTSGDGDSPKKA